MTEKPNVPWDSRWRKIPAFPGYYMSQYGAVFNMNRKKLVQPYRNSRGSRCIRIYRKDAQGWTGYSRLVAKLLREIFPREAKMTDLEPMTLKDEVKAMRARLQVSPDGEYHIPGVKFSDRNPTVANLHALMSRLSFYFPEYVWSTADSWRPEETGITVRWRRKVKPISDNVKIKEINR